MLGWHSELTTEASGTVGEYFTASIDGSRVAGVGQAPGSAPVVWTTHVLVEDLERALERAEELGGQRLVGPLQLGTDGR